MSVLEALGTLKLRPAFLAAERAASVAMVTRLGFSVLVAAAAACAARRAAAMKLDLFVLSDDAAAVPGSSDPATRSAALWPRAPGSSGKSGGRLESIGGRCAGRGR